MKNITDYSSLLESVIALAKEAAELARKTELSVIEKGAPENIVTVSDLLLTARDASEKNAEKKNRAFNKVFSKAWFLHFYHN